MNFKIVVLIIALCFSAYTKAQLRGGVSSSGSMYGDLQIGILSVNTHISKNSHIISSAIRLPLFRLKISNSEVEEYRYLTVTSNVGYSFFGDNKFTQYNSSNWIFGVALYGADQVVVLGGSFLDRKFKFGVSFGFNPFIKM